jgi:hypothetical protein
MAQIVAAGRIDMLRRLGRTTAAEQFTWAQMHEASDSVHAAYRAPTLVPGLDVRSDAEWRAFVEGVREVLALV